MSFFARLKECIARNNSLLCVGLDTELSKIPEFLLTTPNPMLAFNQQIIDSTSSFVCAYKINSAFYEAQGKIGLEALAETKKYIPSYISVILDAKRADIGNSSKMYAKAAFEVLGFDAITVNPYLGFDSIEPFLQYEDKGVFVLCLTSNKGANDFQTYGDPPLFIKVAEAVSQWNKKNNCGIVVGATKIEFLKQIRETAPDLPWLVPGIGAQGGSVEEVIKYGGENLIINSSRAIIYSGRVGSENLTRPDFAAKAGESSSAGVYPPLCSHYKEANFAIKAGESARRQRDEINRYRKNI